MPEVEIEDETTREANAAVDTTESPDSQKVFLNPTTRDTLLSDLVNGSYNTDVIKGSKGSANNDRKETVKKQIVATSQSSQATKPSMTVATRDPSLAYNRLNSA